MSQSPLLAFRSNTFKDEAGIDEATNPGIFGKALAEWFSQQLGHQNVSVDEILAEDFGWCVVCEVHKCRVYLACTGDNNEPFAWQVFIFADNGLLSRRLFGKDRRIEAVESLFAIVRRILESAPEVSELREESASA